jgi:hypothetical protein
LNLTCSTPLRNIGKGVSPRSLLFVPEGAIYKAELLPQPTLLYRHQSSFFLKGGERSDPTLSLLPYYLSDIV